MKLETTSIYKSPWCELLAKKVKEEEDPYYALKVSDYVSVLPITENGNFLLVEQFRPAVELVTLEFPSGHLEANETTIESGKRELIEETGYEGGTWTQLPTLKTDIGRLINSAYAYVAKGVKPIEHYEGEEGIKVLEVSENELLDLIYSEKFIHSLHVSSYFMAKHKKLL